MSSQCRAVSCRAPVEWVTMHSSGRKMPMDVQPVDPATHGAFVVVNGEAFSFREAVDNVMARRDIFFRPEAEEIVRRDYPSHTSHFATCPEANERRRTRC